MVLALQIPSHGGKGAMRAPPARDAEWLDVFTSHSTNFFANCDHCRRNGTGGRETSANHFCIACADPQGFCSKCAAHHAGHPSLQIRRSSYHDVVRVQDLAAVTDVSGIQTYMINSSKVIFIKQRPQPRPCNNAILCVCCRRQLQDAASFCSLRCKLETMGVVAPQDAPPSPVKVKPCPTRAAPVPGTVPVPGTPSNSEGDVHSSVHGDQATSKRNFGYRSPCHRRKRLRPTRSPLW